VQKIYNLVDEDCVQKRNDSDPIQTIYAIGDGFSSKPGTKGPVSFSGTLETKLLRSLVSLNKYVVVISEMYTSQACPKCLMFTHYTSSGTLRIKVCTRCKIHWHRDIMGAMNIATIAFHYIFKLPIPKVFDVRYHRVEKTSDKRNVRPLQGDDLPKNDHTRVVELVLGNSLSTDPQSFFSVTKQIQADAPLQSQSIPKKRPLNPIEDTIERRIFTSDDDDNDDPHYVQQNLERTYHIVYLIFS